MSHLFSSYAPSGAFCQVIWSKLAQNLLVMYIRTFARIKNVTLTSCWLLRLKFSRVIKLYFRFVCMLTKVFVYPPAVWKSVVTLALAFVNFILICTLIMAS